MGIAAILARSGGPFLREHVQRMIERLQHDPDGISGAHSCPDLGVFAGWAADSDTPSPVSSSEDQTVVLLLAGEEFSGSAGVNGCPGRGAALIAAYQRCGADFILQLNGWFSGILIDSRRETVTVFNDRFGLGRLYYQETPDGFRFATEAKALLAISPECRALDQRSLAEWFSVGCVLQNRTLFKGIALVPPGSAWTFHRDGRVAKRRYFDPSTLENQPPLSAGDYSAHLRETFRKAVARILHAETKVGLSLTGGLDSRAVIAWARGAREELQCYTFGGPYRDCADVAIARKLAQVAACPHTTIRVGDDFFADFAQLAERTVYLSDGAMDVSGAIELHVNRKARAIAPIRLTGNYGSEILRSHVAFRPRKLDRSHFVPEFNRLIDEAEQTYREESASHRLTFIAFKQVPWHHFSRFSVEKSQLTPRSPFLDNDLVALAYRVPPHLDGSATPVLRLIADGNPEFADIASDRALRLSAVPFMSKAARQWQEFTAKAEYAYDYGMPQWLARADRVMSRLHLERLVLGRHKFYHFRIWYRDALRDYVAARGARHTHPFCYREGVQRRLTSEHAEGRANHTLELHKLFSLQLIEESLLRP